MGRLVSYFVRFLILSFTFRFRFPKTWCKYVGLIFKKQTGSVNKNDIFFSALIYRLFYMKLFISTVCEDSLINFLNLKFTFLALR
jgi:hypothetical protein